jgi:NAD-dependent dihydropyrimidine dehydrogenase PreA subunit
MKIDSEQCSGCSRCIPYCPVGSIKKSDVGVFPTSVIDQEGCVDCGVCIRSGVCKSEAIYLPETPWPRSIRAAFSGGGFSFGQGHFSGGGASFGRGNNPTRGYSRILDKIGLPKLTLKDIVEKRVGGGSRGTSEMKTNDVTGRFREGEVGIACELGRPGIGFCFKDLETVAVALIKCGVQLESQNPVTVFLDTSTGRIKDEFAEIRGERALSAIIECKAPIENAIEIYRVLQKVAEQIDTVFTLDFINKCQDGAIPLKTLLDDAGIHVRINGKTNVGLGRPLIP